MNLQSELKNNRLEMKLSQAQLSKLSGVTIRTISAIENSKGMSVSTYTLEQLAKGLRKRLTVKFE